MITFRQIDSHVTPDAAPDPAMISALVTIFRDARRDRLQFLLDLHDAGEDAEFLRSQVIPQNHFWIAEAENQIAGFIAFAPGHVNHLYIAPAFQRRGIGAALLNRAKDANSSLDLWAFQANTPAIEFYLSQGFHIAERTDGRTNEAGMPDVRMEWQRSGCFGE